MSNLTFETVDIPTLAAQGARYVVIAIFGEWRDGDVTNDPLQIPQVQRELRKRFMTRFDGVL